MLGAALSLAAMLAHTAGLGRLTVLSPLGQPLNAEVEIVSLQPGEEEGLSARLAPPEAFAQAGMEISPALLGMRLSIERRDGRPVLRLRTAQPVNEPFLDVLVELQWSTGRLLREYTFLLDPPEYKAPPPIAAAPAPKPAAPVAQPPPPLEAKPERQPEPQPEVKPEPRPEPALITAAPLEAKPEAAPETPAAPPGTSYEVKRGDTLGAIARQNLAPGITLNQMLIALYRANPDAFIRENVNLVRAGRILNIPDIDGASTVDPGEANRLVKAHLAEFLEYRSRVAAAPTGAEVASGQRDVTGKIEPKPEAPAPAAPQDQLRLSKADPQKPAAPSARAAREDDQAARERALKEAQSRVTDLEKNVSDLQKLLELKNQQLAELEKRAGVKPAPAPVAPLPAPPAAIAPEKPAVVAEAPKPAPEAKKAAPEKPKAKPAPPPPPAREWYEEYLEDPIFVGGLGLVVVLLILYGLYSWRRKRVTQAKFQDSVLGAAAGGAAFGVAGAAGSTSSQASVSQPLAGMEAEEVDPIAEADVYMAYGRDAQAEEILKEALQKDANRVPVHAKLAEIYANRKDAKSFEQTALKLKNLTRGAGPEWDKAAALGRSIEPLNSLYGGGTAAAPAAAAAAAAASAAAAPALDFDLGGSSQAGSSPDITLDEKRESSVPSIDFDLGTAAAAAAGDAKSDFTPEGTLIMEKDETEATVSGLDFDLNLGGEKKAESSGGGLDFDLNLDVSGGEKKPEAEKSAPMDLSSISLDLGSAGEPSPASGGGADPKWQEVATKLDLAKAYEEMGDKDGARELLNEVMKDGDAAQKGQAQQLLAKLA
jgi:pilus assembly protein FimV